MCCVLVVCSLFCFFKQKSAYEMRIRDWSSDVCSSDLQRRLAVPPAIAPASPMPLPEPRWIAVPRLDPGYAQDLLAVAVTDLCPFEPDPAGGTPMMPQGLDATFDVDPQAGGFIGGEECPNHLRWTQYDSAAGRSERRRVGKGCGSTGRS